MGELSDFTVTRDRGEGTCAHADRYLREEYIARINRVIDYIEELLPDDGPAFEMYLNDPDTHPEKKAVVDICMTVKPL